VRAAPVREHAIARNHLQWQYRRPLPGHPPSALRLGNAWPPARSRMSLTSSPGRRQQRRNERRPAHAVGRLRRWHGRWRQRRRLTPARAGLLYRLRRRTGARPLRLLLQRRRVRLSPPENANRRPLESKRRPELALHVPAIVFVEEPRAVDEHGDRRRAAGDLRAVVCGGREAGNTRSDVGHARRGATLAAALAGTYIFFQRAPACRSAACASRPPRAGLR
jgi:hypothetical protein